jgi:hypothetical protein
MTATTFPIATATRTARPTGTASPVLKAGAVAGAVAAVATTAVAVVAKAIDVPLEAAPKTADAAQAIPMYGFAMGTLLSTAIGIVIAVALARWTKRPGATFVAVTLVLTAVSFAGPATTGYATTATRFVLDLTHVVAAAIVIPAIARRLRTA